MNRLSNRITKLEQALAPGEKFKVFTGDSDTDFRALHQEYLAAGGNPKALFINIIRCYKTDTFCTGEQTQ